MRPDKPRPPLVDLTCGRTPDEIPAYRRQAQARGVPLMKPENYVWTYEPMLNRDTGHFICPDCADRLGAEIRRR